MPAVNFNIIWPDGDKAQYYCPSTIILQNFKEGEVLGQAEFKRKITQTLETASERVKQKFGYYCSAAAAEQEKINKKLNQLAINKIDGDITLSHFN